MKSPLSAPALLELFKQTYQEWNEDKAPRLGAALSYYTVFSIAPLLLILISIAGFVFGEAAARGEISSQITRVVGSDAARLIETMAQGAQKPGAGILASIIGFVTLIMGAMGVFGQLQDALNTIWNVAPPAKQPLWATIKARFRPFLMLIGVAFLLLVSLAASTVISVLGNFVSEVLPLPSWVLQFVNLAVGFGIITLLFAAIFKALPEAHIQWPDVWIGSILTTFLFLIGQMGLSWYVARIASDSAYGAAGSLVAVLLWVYWSSQILFFGAEFTQVYANKYGSKLLPAADGVAGERTQETAALEQAQPSTPTQVFLKQSQVNEAAQKEEALREMVEDVGTILTGVGIALILHRLFSRKDR